MANKGETGYYHPAFNIIRAVGVVLSFLGIGIGVLYVLHGQLVFSIVLSLVFVVGLFLISDQLRKLKIKERKSPYYQPEYVFGGIYALVFIVSLFFFAHFWNIELNKKDDFKRTGINRLEEIKTMRDAYISFVTTTINAYEDSVETTMTNFFLADKNTKNVYKKQLETLLGENTVDYTKYMVSPRDTVLKNKIISDIEAVKNDKVIGLKAKYDLGKANTDFESFYIDAQKTFKNWDYFNLSKAFFDVDIQYAKLLEVAKHKSDNQFVYKDLKETDFEIDNPFDISANFLIALFFFALFNLAILSVYIMAVRYIPDNSDSNSDLIPDTH